MNDLLSVSNLSIGYKKAIQKNLNFSVEEGGVLFIKGRNGSGKTTLIKTLFGDKKPLEGNVYWSVDKKEVAILPQLVTHEVSLSVTLGEILDCFLLKEEVKDIIPEELKKRRFNDASGGERQKALILTRLRQGISFLILDEPFNHMDTKAIGEVLDFLSHLLDEKIIKGIILISHVAVDFDQHKVVEVELL